MCQIRTPVLQLQNSFPPETAKDKLSGQFDEILWFQVSQCSKCQWEKELHCQPSTVHKHGPVLLWSHEVHCWMWQGSGSYEPSISSLREHSNRWTCVASEEESAIMTKYMVLNLSAKHIQVNSVSPGWVWSPEVAKVAVGGRSSWEPIWRLFTCPGVWLRDM